MNPPMSPPLSAALSGVASVASPTKKKEIDVKALLQTSYQGVTARIVNGTLALIFRHLPDMFFAEEQKAARIFSFRVKKPRKKTEVLLDTSMLYKKRTITVDWNDPPGVFYSSSSGAAKRFPGPDRVQRVGIEPDNEVKQQCFGRRSHFVTTVLKLVLVFFFENASWKNKTQLKLFFRNMRERGLFLDVYMGLPPSSDDVNSRSGSRVEKRNSLSFASAPPAQDKISVFVVSLLLLNLLRFKNISPALKATWNMGNEAAPADLSPWIKPGYDLYAVAAQETTLSKKQQVTESCVIVLCCFAQFSWFCSRTRS